MTANPQAPQPPTAIIAASGRAPLRGTRLHLARSVWVIVTLTSLALFLLSIPYHIIYISSRLPMELGIALMQSGISTDFYIGYLLLQDVLIVAGYALTGIAIYRSRSDDWITLFISLALITFGVVITSLEGDTSPLHSLVTYLGFMDLPVALLQSLGLGMFLLVFYLFPDGLFVPRWTRPAAVVWIVWLAAWTLFSRHGTALFEPSALLRFVMRMLMVDLDQLKELGGNLRLLSRALVLSLWFGSGVLAQVLRYATISTPLQRRQTKWAVLGLVGSAVIYFAARLAPPLFMLAPTGPGLAALRYELVALPISTFGLLLAPVLFNVSMHRYRLWDVDYLINRTLLYTSLSLVVLLFYVVNILIVQQIFSGLLGTQSTLVVILSTLALAALFSPLRRLLQRLIDRRFFRQTANFRQVFTGFAREIRTIIELPELMRTLVERTTAILHIEYGGLYL
ncbi:MAG: hypothetical protein ACKOC5_05935, partial [Chloroflexota bacterium]